MDGEQQVHESVNATVEPIPRSIRENPRYGIYGEFTWAFVLEEPDEGRTRLTVRSRIDGRPRALIGAFYSLLLEFPHFVMERGMLKGIKKRAERKSRRKKEGTI